MITSSTLQETTAVREKNKFASGEPCYGVREPNEVAINRNRGLKNPATAESMLASLIQASSKEDIFFFLIFFSIVGRPRAPLRRAEPKLMRPISEIN